MVSFIDGILFSVQALDFWFNHFFFFFWVASSIMDINLIP